MRCGVHPTGALAGRQRLLPLAGLFTFPRAAPLAAYAPSRAAGPGGVLGGGVAAAAPARGGRRALRVGHSSRGGPEGAGSSGGGSGGALGPRGPSNAASRCLSAARESSPTGAARGLRTSAGGTGKGWSKGGLSASATTAGLRRSGCSAPAARGAKTAFASSAASGLDFGRRTLGPGCLAQALCRGGAFGAGLLSMVSLVFDRERNKF